MDWLSSYEKNNYGSLFYSLIRVYRPRKVVELGTEAGYSAYHIARGLKDNGQGSLDCYDLWEEFDAENYRFYAVPKTTAQQNLDEFKDIIHLYQEDALGVEKKYDTIDILHIDLHNDGNILSQVIPSWIEKVTRLIIIEGGSQERDQVGWMEKFHKAPINKWLKDFSRQNPIDYFCFEPFPSITIIKKHP